MQEKPTDLYENEESEDFDTSEDIDESEDLDEPDGNEKHKKHDLHGRPRKTGTNKRHYKQANSKISLNLLLIVIAIVAIAVAVCVVCVTFGGKSDSSPAESVSPSPTEKPKETVITVSTLEKILETEKLSTYEVEYSGVAVRYDEKKTENVDYYVSYKATVKAGIDFDKIEIMLDSESKRIVAQLPKVEISTMNVDQTSLDYLFYDKKLNKSGITAEAYALCKEDLSKKVEENDTILDIATQNTKNAVAALLSPFIEAMGDGYTLQVREAA